MSERKLIREFLDRANLDACLMCGKTDCNCMSNSLSSYDVEIDSDCHSDHEGQHHYHDLDPNKDGHITPEDLYSHFDSNNNGQVTTQDYVDHINFHCEHPESLDHYKKAREISIQSVPCKDSYDSCSKHLMGCSDDIDNFLRPLMDQTGSTCRASSTKAFIDVLQSLINCGVLK